MNSNYKIFSIRGTGTDFLSAFRCKIKNNSGYTFLDVNASKDFLSENQIEASF